MLVILGILSYLIQMLFYKKEKAEPNQEAGIKKETVQGENCMDSCGLENHSCIKKCLARKEETDIVYYEDEELDTFKNRKADSYNEDEIESFRYVLNTLQRSDIVGWVCSLRQRRIALPLCLKEEARILLGKD